MMENGKQSLSKDLKDKKDAKPWIEKTVEELEEKLNVMLDEEYQGITFKEFSNIYIKHLELHREYYTVLNYKTTFDKFSKLDNKHLDQVSQLDIQIIVDGLVEKGLSRGTILDNLKRLNYIFIAAANNTKQSPNLL